MFPLEMKKLGRIILRASIVGIGIPYALVITLYCVMGWPCSQPGEGRYQRALQPTRVLDLNYVLLQQVGMVRLLPLYLRIRKFYNTADTLQKDIPYGRNGNTLDVWQPSDTLHDSSSDQRNDPHKPVFVFIYGGAWASGDKNLYGLLAQSLADNLAAIVCVPNYSIYPRGTVTDMLHDLEDTIEWIKSSEIIKHLGGDSDQIVICGHSAGGHLAALLAVDLAQRTDSQNNSSGLDQSTAIRNLHVSSVRGIIAISGVFHIMDHYHFEASRGVEDLSGMWRAMDGMNNFDKYSPLLRLEILDHQQISRLPPFVLIHGTQDGTVPMSASEKFASSLKHREVPVSMEIIPEGGHSPLVIDMMEEGRHFHDKMINVVREHVRALVECKS